MTTGVGLLRPAGGGIAMTTGVRLLPFDLAQSRLPRNDDWREIATSPACGGVLAMTDEVLICIDSGSSPE